MEHHLTAQYGAERRIKRTFDTAKGIQSVLIVFRPEAKPYSERIHSMQCLIVIVSIVCR